MNTQKLESLKKSLDNKYIPDNMKDKIRAEIAKLEAEIKTDDSLTKAEIKEEIKEISEKVEDALEVAEEKKEEVEAKKESEQKKPVTKTTAKKAPVKKTDTTQKKKTPAQVAKEIRKEGESWKDALKRASQQMSGKKDDEQKTVKTEANKILSYVNRRKALKSLSKGKVDLIRDSKRTALPAGKRISASGKVYYENRDNRTDRLAPNYPSKIYLANGGSTEEVKELKGYSVNIYKNRDSDSNIVPTNGRVILVTDGMSGDSSKVMSNEPHLMLVKRFLFGKEYLHAVPVNYKGSDSRTMFGGNFIWSTDSSFRNNVSEQPIQLHDRVEKYELGGSIKNQYDGKTAEEVWNNLSVSQRHHFLNDHKKEIESTPSSIEKSTKTAFKFLPTKIKNSFKKHISEGQYAKGGRLKSALMRDRNNFNHFEKHEIAY